MQALPTPVVSLNSIVFCRIEKIFSLSVLINDLTTFLPCQKEEGGGKRMNELHTSEVLNPHSLKHKATSLSFILVDLTRSRHWEGEILRGVGTGEAASSVVQVVQSLAYSYSLLMGV